MVESQGKQIADKQLAVSGAEVILLVLLVVFGMGLCVWVERAFTWLYPEPTQPVFMKPLGIEAKQEELMRLGTLQNAAETQLAAIELDQLKQTATIISLEAQYPDIAKPNQTAISTEAQRSYEAAKTQRLASEALTTLLNGRIVRLKSDAKVLSEELEPAKRFAAEELRRAKTRYLLAKLTVSFFVPFVVVILTLFVLRSFLKRVAQREMWTNQGALPFLLVACALLILLGYQALEVAGAVLIAIILFLILLWKIDWSMRAGRKAE
jgi:membrane-associated HD superfamily phosphohydrolase